jgi:cytochrome c-type biogenesis protein CcmH/NrfG
MDVKTVELKAWSSAQVYGLAVVCLVAGIAVGYLCHAPATPAVQNATASSVGTAADSAKMGPQSGSLEQIKSMADKAAQPLLEKLKQNPNDVELMAQVASIYAKAQQFDTSIEYCKRAIKAKPSAQLYTFQASIYHAAGNEDLAIENLNHALEMDPTDANALLNLGMLKYRIKGDPKGAIALWEKLLQTNPNNPHRTEIQELIAKLKKQGAGAPK